MKSENNYILIMRFALFFFLFCSICFANITQEKRIYNLRSVLLENLENNNSVAVLNILDSLNKITPNNYPALTDFEYSKIYFEAGLYDSAEVHLSKLYSDFFYDKNPSINFQWKDQLDSFLYSDNLSLKKYYDKIQDSKIDDERKNSLEILLTILFDISVYDINTGVMDSVFEEKIQLFINKYSMNHNTPLFENLILENTIKKKHLKEMRKKNYSDFQYPYRESSFSAGCSFLLTYPMLTGNLSEEFTPIMGLETSLYFKAINFIIAPYLGWQFLLNNHKIDLDTLDMPHHNVVPKTNIGVLLGLKIIDEESFNVVPFIGLGESWSTFMYGNYEMNIVLNEGLSQEYIVGIFFNISFTPRSNLQFKYSATFTDHDFGYDSLDGVIHSFSFGIMAW